MAKIKGVPIEMGGSEWIVAPLTIAQIRESQADRATCESEEASLEARTDAAARIILPALQRNYPEITAATLEGELLDAGNVFETLRAVLTGSGLRPAQAGEAAAARTGPASTGSSPPPAATGPETSTG
ncbi:MAG TPA: hypothetical protein VMS01_04230 [Stellaceae bacterium]|nr:hypothetical protein [Stellaceae bacterium]